MDDKTETVIRECLEAGYSSSLTAKVAGVSPAQVEGMSPPEVCPSKGVDYDRLRTSTAFKEAVAICDGFIQAEGSQDPDFELALRVMVVGSLVCQKIPTLSRLLGVGKDEVGPIVGRYRASGMLRGNGGFAGEWADEALSPTSRGGLTIFSLTLGALVGTGAVTAEHKEEAWSYRKGRTD